MTFRDLGESHDRQLSSNAAFNEKVVCVGELGEQLFLDPRKNLTDVGLQRRTRLVQLRLRNYAQAIGQPLDAKPTQERVDAVNVNA